MWMLDTKITDKANADKSFLWLTEQKIWEMAAVKAGRKKRGQNRGFLCLMTLHRFVLILGEKLGIWSVDFWLFGHHSFILTHKSNHIATRPPSCRKRCFAFSLQGSSNVLSIFPSAFRLALNTPPHIPLRKNCRTCASLLFQILFCKTAHCQQWEIFLILCDRRVIYSVLESFV